MKLLAVIGLLCFFFVLNAATENDSENQARPKRGLLLGALGAGLIGAKVAGGALLGAGIVKGIGLGYYSRPSYYYSGGYGGRRYGGYDGEYGGGYGGGISFGYGGYGGYRGYGGHYYW